MENYSEIIELIIKIVITVLSILVSMIVPKIKTWIESKLTASQIEKSKVIVRILVQAAEQLLKNSDPTGEKRKAYVQEQISKLGNSLGNLSADMINDLIESAVLETNSVVNKS